MTAKDTKGKAKLGLIPYNALVQIASVREFGVEKYGDDTCWRQVAERDFLEAAIRHIYKALEGEEIDPESGRTHIAHAATSLVLALANHEAGTTKQSKLDKVLSQIDTATINRALLETDQSTLEDIKEAMFGPASSPHASIEEMYDRIHADYKMSDDYEELYSTSYYHPTHYPTRRK